MTLDEWRRREGLTYVALGRRLGLEPTSNPTQRCARYCALTRMPSRAVIRRIAEVTNGEVTDADFPVGPLPLPASSPKTAA